MIIDAKDLEAFAYLATLPGARDTLIGNANTDGTAWMYAVAGLHPLWTHYDYPVQQGPGYHRFIFWAYADDADTDPRVAEAVKALNIRYVLTSTPVVRGFAMPDGLVSLEKSRSWEKIYDNGEARIYEWRGRVEENAERMTTNTDDDNIEIIGGDGRWTPDDDDADGKSLTDLVEQPAKVMRIGTMIKQLLEEVRAAPLDDASRNRLRDIHKTSIRELEDGLAPELRDELERLTLPFTEDAVPSDAELRIAQAQLVGWLEGLFHGIQTALFAQQMAARQQLEQMRQGALPPGVSAPGQRGGPARPGTGQYL